MRVHEQATLSGKVLSLWRTNKMVDGLRNVEFLCTGERPLQCPLYDWSFFPRMGQDDERIYAATASRTP